MNFKILLQSSAACRVLETCVWSRNSVLGAQGGGETAACSSCCWGRGRKDPFWLVFNKAKKMGCELRANYFLPVFAGNQQLVEGCWRFMFAVEPVNRVK